MTQTQYQTLTLLLHRLESKVDSIEERLQFEFPTVREAREQLDAEINSILGVGVRVFAADD